MKVRQQLGELLSRSKLRGEEFIIEQHGKPTAVLLPYAKVQRQRKAAWAEALEVLVNAVGKKSNKNLSAQALNTLVNEAIHKSRA